MLVMELPNNYIECDSEEMEYIDGGGTLSLKISASTLKFAINRCGWAAGSFLGAVALSYFGPLGTKLGAFIGGLLGGFIGSAIGSYIASKVVKGSVTIKYSHWMMPNCSISI